MKKSDILVSPTSIKSDMVDDYWNSDHHRFEWTNFMQKLDPLSWHALAISYPDSFLKGMLHSISSISDLFCNFCT